MLQARRDGRRLMRVVMGRDNASEFQTFWQRTSSACWWIRSGGAGGGEGDACYFSGANVCGSLLWGPFSEATFLKTFTFGWDSKIRSCHSLQPQLLPGPPVSLWHARVHLCAFNSVLLLDWVPRWHVVRPQQIFMEWNGAKIVSKP